ncbi:hypothetical protein V2J09_011592 [Rumex salicifolius]
MALVAVGDFVDCQSVIELIKEHFGSIPSADPQLIPVIEVPFHKEPRYSCLVESEASGVTRVRLHGFSEREINIVKAEVMSAMESAYLEREQYKSTTWRNMYIQHFVRDSSALGAETDARLDYTVGCVRVRKQATDTIQLCDYKFTTIEPRASVKVEDLRSVISKIASQEEQKTIAKWEDKQIPEEIVVKKPIAGVILQQSEYSEIGVTELILSNGMKVCYKCTDFKNDQGFALGGYSELSETEYLSRSMGSSIASQIGKFGYKPTDMVDMLAGKREEVGTHVAPYTRSFYGDCSPSDLETALQLVYQLFVTNVEPVEDDIARLNQIMEEIIQAEERDPSTAFCKR